MYLIIETKQNATTIFSLLVLPSLLQLYFFFVISSLSAAITIVTVWKKLGKKSAASIKKRINSLHLTNVPHATNKPLRGTLIRPTPISDTRTVKSKISALDLLFLAQICFITKPLVMMIIADVMVTNFKHYCMWSWENL